MLPSQSRTLNRHGQRTVQEAAQRLGISQDAVRQRIRRGSIRHDKDDKGRVYVYLDPTNTRPTPVHDAPSDTVPEASRSNELVTELRNRIQFLETELTDRKEESRRKDHIIAALTQRIPELEPPSEPREYSERPTEHVDRDDKHHRVRKATVGVFARGTGLSFEASPRTDSQGLKG